MFLKPRWQKVFADFWENKARSLLVVTSIFIGVFAVGMLLTSNVILPASLLKVYAESAPPNITVRTTTFQQPLIDLLQNLTGVDSVTARKTIITRARTLTETKWQNLNIEVVQNIGAVTLKKLEVVEGRLPESKDEIVLLEQATVDFPVAIGEQLEVKLKDDTIRTVKVVGVVKDYSAGIEITIDRRVAYANDKAGPFLHSEEGFNTLHLSVQGDQTDLEFISTMAEEIRSAIEDSGHWIYEISTQGIDEHPYENYINAVNLILQSMGILLVGLSSFLIINVLNSLMSQQVRQIGVMKLIGAQTKDIAVMYLCLVGLFGGIAFLIGVPTSAYAAHWMCSQIAVTLNGYLTTTATITLIPHVILIQAAVAFFVPMGTSLVPILNGARVSVQQALNNSLIKHRESTNRFDHWIEHLKGVYGILLLSIRNTFRSKGRLALTLFTLSMGGAIFIAVFNVQSVLDRHIDTVANYSDADIFLYFAQEYPKKEIYTLAKTIPGLETIEGWSTINAQLETNEETETVYIEAPPDNSSLLTPVNHSGRWVNENEYFTIVVNEDFSRNMPEIKSGDTLTLTIDNRDYAFEIVGFFNYTGLQNKRAYINAKTAAVILGNHSSSRSYRVVLEDHSLESQTAMEEYISDFFSERGYHVARASAMNAIISEAGEKINIVIQVLLILALLTGVVGSIGLSGTLSLNVLERTSEIGILRAIGAHDKIVAKLVLFEGLFIGLTSYLIGFGLSFPVSLVLGNIVNMAIFRAEAQLTIDPLGYLTWLILIILMSILASLLPVRNATKLTIREVLAYE